MPFGLQNRRRPGGLPPFKLTVGPYDFTNEAENITYSNVDPGGFEMCSFDLQAGRADIINPGDKIRITDGPIVLWEGRVAEPERTIRRGWRVNRRVGAASTRVSGEGNGAGLKDNLMSMIYVDRDLTQWREPSVTRQISLINSSEQITPPTASPDPTTGLPAVVQSFADSWVAPNIPLAEMWYDSGPQNLIAKLYYNVLTSSGAAALAGIGANLYLSSDDIVTTDVGTGNLISSSGVSGYFAPAATFRYALGEFKSTTTPGGVQGANYQQYWRNLTVYGNHGLTGRGADPVGFYTSDIAQHAAFLAIAAGGNFRLGRVDTFAQYVVPHYVQRTPVAHEVVISDMAKLAPAHYGVWESDSIFDDIPTFTFRAYGSDADFFTSMGDCDEVDVSERLANLYSKAMITFTDAAGAASRVTVSLPNYLLSRAGIVRTQTLDLGISSSAVATVFANYVLQLLFAQARMAGSVQLPSDIRDRNGAMVPSYRLRAGLHRLRIGDLPQRTGLITSSDSDSFRVSRVECNVDTTAGRVSTRAELDAGPNLIETLTARLNIAQTFGNF